MWLKNDVLRVFFDEHRGGMPTKDSFGFIRAASIEIASAWPPPFFQSFSDENPHIRKHGDSKLMVSGVMRKDLIRGGYSPHTYEMAATLDGNKLDLAYKLNVARTENIIVSKIWLFSRFFQKCAISDGVAFDAGGADGRDEDNWFYPFIKGSSWRCIYAKEGKQPESITLFDAGGRLEVLGATTPPILTKVFRRGCDQMEVAFGWATGTLQKGTYSGNLVLVYGGLVG